MRIRNARAPWCLSIIPIWILSVFAAVANMAAEKPARQPESPQRLFSFAAVADGQYAAKAKAGKRDYYASMRKLQQFVASVNQSKPAFAIQLGDLIDGGTDNLDRILAVYDTIKVPRRHVLGNHDFCTDRATLLKRMGLRKAYYTFSRSGWRFVVLDGMDVSLSGGWPPASEKYQSAQRMLSDLLRAGKKNAFDWNGGIGAEQRQWLQQVLQKADARRERVVIFCHFPILERASSADHLLWNHDDVQRIVESSSSVVAFISGHDHDGGYAYHNGIHYVTLQGMVESGDESAYCFVDGYDNRLEIKGTGTVKCRSLQLHTGPNRHL